MGIYLLDTGVEREEIRRQSKPHAPKAGTGHNKSWFRAWATLNPHASKTEACGTQKKVKIGLAR